MWWCGGGGGGGVWVWFFFFNDTATTEIYTLSLHDALPIFTQAGSEGWELVAAGLADGYQEGGFLSEGTQILGGQFFAVFKRPGNG